MILERIVPVLVVLSAAGSLAAAGELYGKVLEGKVPVKEAASLEVTCGAKTYSAKTDKSGSYRMVVTESGRCSMTVSYKQQAATLDIASYDDPVQVDLVVELKDGKLSVRRK